jgi:hypothetical protein
MFDLHERRRSLTASTFLYRDSDIVEARHGAAAQSPTIHLPSNLKFILLAVEAHLCVDMSARKERARLIFLPMGTSTLRLAVIRRPVIPHREVNVGSRKRAKH